MAKDRIPKPCCKRIHGLSSDNGLTMKAMAMRRSMVVPAVMSP